MLQYGSLCNPARKSPRCFLFSCDSFPELCLKLLDCNTPTPSLKDSQFGTYSNWSHLQAGYSFSCSPQLFSNVYMFCYLSPFNITPNSKSSTSASDGFPRQVKLWQGYKFPQSGFSKSDMFPPQQFPEQDLLTLSAPQLPPNQLGNNQVI